MPPPGSERHGARLNVRAHTAFITGTQRWPAEERQRKKGKAQGSVERQQRETFQSAAGPCGCSWSRVPARVRERPGVKLSIKQSGSTPKRKRSPSRVHMGVMEACNKEGDSVLPGAFHLTRVLSWNNPHPSSSEHSANKKAHCRNEAKGGGSFLQ